MFLTACQVLEFLGKKRLGEIREDDVTLQKPKTLKAGGREKVSQWMRGRLPTNAVRQKSKEGSGAPQLKCNLYNWLQLYLGKHCKLHHKKLLKSSITVETAQ